MGSAEERFVKLEKDIENVREKVDETGKKVSHIDERMDKMYQYIVEGGLKDQYAEKHVEHQVEDLKKKVWWFITFILLGLFSIIGWLVKIFII